MSLNWRGEEFAWLEVYAVVQEGRVLAKTDFREPPSLTSFVVATVVPEPGSCDFNEDGLCGGFDINQLMNETATGGIDTDLTGDGIVNKADRDEWLALAGPANGFTGSLLVGDSNLDGTVDSADLNALALNWRLGSNNWSDGNFTSAGVDSADLNELALNWRQSISIASSASAPVPEPSALLLTFVGLALVWRRRRHKLCETRKEEIAHPELACLSHSDT